MDSDKIIEYIKKMDAKLDGLVEINARLAQEIIHLKSNTDVGTTQRTFNTGSTSAKPKQTGLVVTVDEDSIKVSGNTYNHRDIFRIHGGNWIKEHSHWEIHVDNKEDLIESLKDIEHIVKEN